jgi:predicted TIM-barrel fold metal-dependent hydrolase
MDDEGIDCALMVPTGIETGSRDGDIEFYRANHRYLDDFCAAAPSRLKSLVVANGAWVDESVREIHHWGKSNWAVGVHLVLPIGLPLDHPDMEPVWAAAQEENLPIVHHSFATGYPGHRDLWSNPFLGRTASHPWGAMRAVAAFYASGIADRFPDLKMAVLESGFGWLPFWAKRMEDQVDYQGFVAEGLQHSMWEYMTDGRFFASIVLHEGGPMVQMVSDMMNDGILMFSTDYPHPETRFPDSVDLTLSWKLDDALNRKILWDNAVKCFGEP